MFFAKVTYGSNAATSSKGMGVFIVDSSSIDATDPPVQPYGINWASFNGLGVLSQPSTSSVFAVNSGVYDCTDAAALNTIGCGNSPYDFVILVSIRDATITVVTDSKGATSLYRTHVLNAPLATPLNMAGTTKYAVIAAYSETGSSDTVSVNRLKVFLKSSTCSPACTPPKVCSAGACVCSQGWTGVNCDVATCVEPCQNGGSCLYPEFCDCPLPYGGQYCEACKYFIDSNNQY